MSRPRNESGGPALEFVLSNLAEILMGALIVCLVVSAVIAGMRGEPRAAGDGAQLHKVRIGPIAPKRLAE